MATLLTPLVLGFVLGLRHATDPDHVVAMSTVVSGAGSVRRAALAGSLWGLGHSATVLVLGGVLVVTGIVIPPRLSLSFELLVAAMLITLGVLRLSREGRGHEHGPLAHRERGLLRSLVVGVVHGLAGSAAIALIVLGSIPNPLSGVLYLLLFGAGTIVGMVLLSSALAMPLAITQRRFGGLGHKLGVAAGLFSVALGLFLAYRVGFVDGLFVG